jgi:uroporphyrin-III C-methyltransferase
MRIAELAKCSDTLVILMGMSRLPAIADALLEGGLSPNRPVAVIESGTTARMRSLVTCVGQMAEDIERARLCAPGVIVVGDVVSLHNHTSGRRGRLREFSRRHNPTTWLPMASGDV